MNARKCERNVTRNIVFLYSHPIVLYVLGIGNRALLPNKIIVETKFLELAMSLLDFSSRIPLGTFSILHTNHMISIPSFSLALFYFFVFTAYF